MSINDDEVLYRDVPVESWFAPFVSLLIESEVAQGYRDDQGNLTGEFGVANPVTFAEVLKMAIEAGDIPLDDQPPRNRSARGTWASAYVGTAETLGFAVFTPNLAVHDAATRGAVVQTILEALGVPVGSLPGEYSDLPKNHPYAAAIGTATHYGLITGDTAADGSALGTVRPDDPINRAEASKIIALVLELLKDVPERD